MYHITTYTETYGQIHQGGLARKFCINVEISYRGGSLCFNVCFIPVSLSLCKKKLGVFEFYIDKMFVHFCLIASDRMSVILNKTLVELPVIDAEMNDTLMHDDDGFNDIRQ